MNKKYSFKIIINENCNEGKIIYEDYEINFITNNKIEGNIFSLILGGYTRLYFSDINNKAVWLGGYNPFESWKKINLIFPNSQNGEIYIEEELKNKDIMDEYYCEDWKTYYDKKQNIVCIGDYKSNSKDIAVEFCNNIVAVFEDKYLKAIWIKDIIFKS